MAEGGPGRGRGGRGALIAKLLEMEKKPGPAPVPPVEDGPPIHQVKLISMIVISKYLG